MLQDRNGRALLGRLAFEPQIVQKGQLRLSGFDDKIISMYALGLTVRDIQLHLKDLSLPTSPLAASKISSSPAWMDSNDCPKRLKVYSRKLTPSFASSVSSSSSRHWLRHSLNYVASKDKKAVVSDLPLIYRTPTAEAAKQALEVFEEKWNRKYPTIATSWRTDWARIVGLLAFSEPIQSFIPRTHCIS